MAIRIERILIVKITGEKRKRKSLASGTRRMISIMPYEARKDAPKESGMIIP